MRNTVLFLLVALIVQSLAAQPWPRKEHPVMDKSGRMTDANTNLFSVRSDYGFPYEIPLREDVTDKLMRILHFLERSTAKAIINPETGVVVTDYDRIPDPFAFEEGDFRPFNYEWGVTYTGMLKAAEVTGVTAFREYVVKRMRLLSDIAPEVSERLSKDPGYASPISRTLAPKNLDQCGSISAAMIRTMSLGEKGIALQPYINTAEEWLTKIQHRLDDGTIARIDPYENTVWLDDLYMSVTMLSELYRTTGNTRYLDDAVRQALRFSERLFDEASGLYLHCWVDVMKVHPRLSWGRANGWAILAMCDLLDVIPASHTLRGVILDRFEAHCSGLLRYQARNGMWHQLIDRNDSYLESSATAMFVYGLAHGINRGWLDAKAFGPAAILGWNGLGMQINDAGQIESVCVGTGVSFEPAYYYHRWVNPYTAHGYGSVLMAGSEIVSLVTNFDIKQRTSIYVYDK